MSPLTPTSAEILDDHLSYPTLQLASSTLEVKQVPPQPRQILQDRLYIGNLHPSVDEYSLLQVFSKFGKVTKMDFLFHKTGALKGKPRGYAFVEYADKSEALKAQRMAHDKLLRGRKLVVTFAQQAPLDQAGQPYASGSHSRRGMSDVGKPTTLSLIKTGGGSRNAGTEGKIAMMEAKLREMEAAKAVPSASSLPSHPSLPAKPVAAMASLSSRPTDNSNTNYKSKPQRPKTVLPSLPMAPPRLSPTSLSSQPTASTLVTNTTPRTHDKKPTAGFLGVKIVKRTK
ncbi:hypothetical protein PC9H_001931 [Pleurotus ostreatus]|uniref:Probable RNA-binding protein 18 n=1 Tax=Pleurotus ostreatus TaxID=5322 RepID=A0A8H7DKX5_PLEOS|nr:uncharacterized protein PC9H_001931 [Pleurotus ostreatus]KAF7419344.1 hypothetical protein PC9H_001931 [Pleurotus ostreatus]